MSDFWFIPSSNSRSEHLQQTEGGEFFSGDKKQTPFFNGVKNGGGKSSAVQAKLTVGASNDKYEKEADVMADKAVQRKSSEDGPSPFFNINNDIQRKCSSCEKEEEEKGSVQKKEELVQSKCAECEKEEGEKVQKKDEAVQMKCAECEKEEQKVQRKDDPVQLKCAECEKKEKEEKEQGQVQKKDDLVQTKCPACEANEEQVQAKSMTNGGELKGKVADQIKSQKGAGNSLDPDVKDEMGSSFGADFSNVKVHTDGNAVHLNKKLGAQAFTHGNDIYFNQGKYEPGSTSGKRLLAHELTHTIQQGHSSRVNGKAERPNVQREEEHSCDKKDEKKGSEEEAKKNETAEDKGHCVETNGPVDQPPKDKKKPKDEEQPKAVEANAGAGVDERQGHAPPAEKDAPGKEKDVQEGAKDKEPKGPCDPQPAPGAKPGAGGAGATGGSGQQAGGPQAGGGGKGAPTGAGQQAPAGGGKEGEGGLQQGVTAEGGPQKGDGKAGAKGGKGKGGEEEESVTGFLKSVSAQGVSPNIIPEGKGESASPELQTQRDETQITEQATAASLAARDGAVSQLVSRGIEYLPVEQEKGKKPDDQMVKDHSRSTIIANTFLSDTGKRLHDFITQGSTNAESIRQKRTDSRLALQEEINTRRNQTTDTFSLLRSNANTKATQAKDAVEKRYIQTVAQIEIKSVLSNLALMVTKITSQPKLDQGLKDQLVKLDEVYTVGYDNLMTVGDEMAEDVKGRAAKHSAAYWRAEGASPEVQYRVQNEVKDGFWDGYLTYNRYKARANSAKETGKQYAEGMQKQAKSQADDMMCGKKTDIEVVNLIHGEGTKNVQCTYDNAVKAVQRNREAALIQAKHAKEELTKAIKDSLEATITQLKEKEAAQLQLITDYGIRQAMAIERDATTAINSFVTGANEAAGKVLDVLTAFVSQSVGTNAPPPLELRDQVRGMKGEINSALGQASGALDNSASGTESYVDTSTGQSKSALSQMCDTGLADARELAGTFESSIDAMNTKTQSTYDTLWTTVSGAIDGETTNGTTQMTAIVTAIADLYTKLNGGLKDRFDESATNMKIGMQKSLNQDFDNKVCVEAEKAAKEVKPWWKTVLKILLIIIVIVIVIVVAGPAIIAAVGGLAASAAGALGASVALAGTIGAWVGAVVGGAIVGALSGAVIQVGNNLIDAIGEGPLTWDKVTKGVWGAIIAGAIGGALGGLGGKFAQLLIGRLATAGITAGYQTIAKYGVELAFDAVGSVLGDLANGNPITLEGIVKGAVIGIIVQKAMGGVGRMAKSGKQAVVTGKAPTRLQKIAAGIENIQAGAAAKGEKFGGAAGSKLGGKSAEWSSDALKVAREAEMPKQPAKEREGLPEETPTKQGEETPGKTPAPEETAPTGKKQEPTEGPEGAPKQEPEGPGGKQPAEPDPALKTKEGETGVKAEKELPGGHKQQIDENFDVTGCSHCDTLKRRYQSIKDKGLVKNMTDAEFEGVMKEFDQVKNEFLQKYGDQILEPPTVQNRGELIQGKTRQQIYDDYLSRVNGVEAKLLPNIDVTRILVVGDSTFEYVKALKKKLGMSGFEEITGTGYEPRERAQEIAEGQGVKLPAEGRQVGPKGAAVNIEHGVDATQLGKKYPADSVDRIIFNNPEMPGTEAEIGQMLNGVLGSAPAVLKPGGQVHIGITGSPKAKGRATLESHLTSGTVEIGGRKYTVQEVPRSQYEFSADYPARKTEGTPLGRQRPSMGPKQYFIFTLLPPGS